MSEVTQSILFRQRLYENFKESGLLDKLKTTLRVNLLEKLEKNKMNRDQKDSTQIQRDKQQKKKPLYLRDKFLACIVRQYLLKSKKQYSLSILLPQSNLGEQDCLNYSQLSQIINLNIIQQEGRSFLETLVDQWTKFRATQIFQRSTQTDYSEPVSKKLEDIQKRYIPKIDYWKLMTHPGQKNQSNSEQSDLSLITKQQRMREQFQIEKKRIRRDLQLSVKAQMEKKYESQYDFKTREIQKAHQGRLTQIKNRQKGILQSLQRKTKELQQKARKINEQQLKMIKKYEEKANQLEIQFKKKIKELENKEKQFWKKELQLKAKKKQYQDTIRLVKQKVIDQTLDI